MKEIWKTIEGWPYEVSSLGRVRRAVSGRGAHVGKILVPFLNHGERPLVALHNGDGIARTMRVRVLVCTTFHGAVATLTTRRASFIQTKRDLAETMGR